MSSLPYLPRLDHSLSGDDARPHLGAVLLKSRMLTPEQLDEALREQAGTRPQARRGARSARVALPQDIAGALATQFGVEYIDIHRISVDVRAASRLHPGGRPAVLGDRRAHAERRDAARRGRRSDEREPRTRCGRRSTARSPSLSPRGRHPQRLAPAPLRLQALELARAEQERATGVRATSLTARDCVECPAPGTTTSLPPVVGRAPGEPSRAASRGRDRRSRAASARVSLRLGRVGVGGVGAHGRHWRTNPVPEAVARSNGASLAARGARDRAAERRLAAGQRRRGQPPGTASRAQSALACRPWSSDGGRRLVPAVSSCEEADQAR